MYMNEEVDELLRAALAKTQPPAGLTDRVMVRMERERVRQSTWKVFAALAATIVLLLSGYAGYRRHEASQARHQLRAGRQLVFALQLVSEKISAVDQRLKRSSAQLSVSEEHFERKNGNL